MSVHTVEAHLTHAYRKLEIHSRGQLASKLGAVPERSS
jgi:DNA-binding CsgD family transcriptional regulator